MTLGTSAFFALALNSMGNTPVWIRATKSLQGIQCIQLHPCYDANNLPDLAEHTELERVYCKAVAVTVTQTPAGLYNNNDLLMVFSLLVYMKTKQCSNLRPDNPKEQSHFCLFAFCFALLSVFLKIFSSVFLHILGHQDHPTLSNR